MKSTTTTCVVCSMDISSKNFKRHYTSHLGGKFECPHCDKCFPTKTIVNAHIKDVHTQKVKCDCCDKIF